jgi:hypothetical protein
MEASRIKTTGRTVPTFNRRHFVWLPGSSPAQMGMVSSTDEDADALAVRIERALGPFSSLAGSSTRMSLCNSARQDVHRAKGSPFWGGATHSPLNRFALGPLLPGLHVQVDFADGPLG